MNFRRLLLVAAIGLFVSHEASAQTFTIHTGVIAPYTNEASNGKASGVIVEIMMGALSAAGIQYSVLDAVPWRRAQADAVEVANSLVSPFARTPQREPSWTWVSVILDEKMYIYTPKGAASPTSADDLKTVKSLGVLAGGAPESIAKELGMESVMQAVTLESQNAQKLVGGRLDAWMSQGYMAAAGMREAKIDPGAVERRFEFRDLPLWVATSPKTSPEAVAKLRGAFDAFKTSPAYAEILKKYN